MEQSAFEAFVKKLRSDQVRLLEEMQPYEAQGYRLLRREPTGGLQDITDQHVAKIKRDIISIEKAIEFVIAQKGSRRA
jgi:hypothetical protein